MRNVLVILAGIQITWPVGLFLIFGNADGMAGYGLAALLAAQVVGLAGMVMLARVRPPLSQPTTSRAAVPLAISLGANITLAVTNLLGVTTGNWCLPLVLGLIPLIGLLYAYRNLGNTTVASEVQMAAPVSTLTRAFRLNR